MVFYAVADIAGLILRGATMLQIEEALNVISEAVKLLVLVNSSVDDSHRKYLIASD
jgi:hypothetical protein